MPLPLILIGIGVAAGGGGVGLGAWGVSDLTKARRAMAEAERKYHDQRATAESAVESANTRLKQLGRQQDEALKAVVLRMGNFLRRNERQVRESERLLVDGIDATMQSVPGLAKLDVDASTLIAGLATSAATGAGVSSGVTTVVTTYAAASTGTAISSLSGAAATNATLAVLGGGTLAEGGGGVALGATVLNVVAIGPALLVGGSMVKVQGSKMLTQAHERATKLKVAAAELDKTAATLAAIELRSDELQTLLECLSIRALTALDLLESEAFDASLHAERFQRAMTLTLAVRDVAATPVIDSDGAASAASETLIIKYRTMVEENAHD